ncbi:protein of unknown function [Moritella yayanosii]|uniref:Uncharacterized protein n=1 Tax=Moritella yayanosii TaxID=69539 RepID=A0A330LLX0_9GAMM|nr:protein of unknown function [Moritella yayanosii]
MYATYKVGQVTLDILIDIVLYSMLGFPLWLVALMVMTWCCPKQLNDNYFKSDIPHAILAILSKELATRS